MRANHSLISAVSCGSGPTGLAAQTGAECSQEDTEGLWEFPAPRESRRPPLFHGHTIWAEFILGPHSRADNKASRSEEDVDLNAPLSSAGNDLISVCRVNNAQKGELPEVSIIGWDAGPCKKQRQPYC